MTILLPTTVTNPSYKGYQSNGASAWTSPASANTEFISGEYSNVQSEDATYASSAGTASILSKYANVAHKFDFDISSYMPISSAILTWKGYISGGPDTSKLQVLTTTGSGGNPPYAESGWSDWVVGLPTTNTEKTKDLGNADTNILLAGGHYWIRFGAFGTYQKNPDSGTITLYTDYAALTVTTSSGVKIPIIMYNRRMQGMSLTNRFPKLKVNPLCQYL